MNARTDKYPVRLFSSVEAMEKYAREEDYTLTPEKRIGIVHYLRKQYYRLKGISPTALNKTVTKSATRK